MGSHYFSVMRTQVPASASGGASPPLSFVFWNLRRNFPRGHLAALMTDHHPDVLPLKFHLAPPAAP